MNIKPIYLRDVTCCSCLSLHRLLKPINDLLPLYRHILQLSCDEQGSLIKKEPGVHEDPIAVKICGKCEATLKNILKFSRQIQKSQEKLRQNDAALLQDTGNLITQSQIDNLSQLRGANKSTYDVEFTNDSATGPVAISQVNEGVPPSMGVSLLGPEKAYCNPAVHKKHDEQRLPITDFNVPNACYIVSPIGNFIPVQIVNAPIIPNISQIASNLDKERLHFENTLTVSECTSSAVAHSIENVAGESVSFVKQENVSTIAVKEEAMPNDLQVPYKTEEASSLMHSKMFMNTTEESTTQNHCSTKAFEISVKDLFESGNSQSLPSQVQLNTFTQQKIVDSQKVNTFSNSDTVACKVESIEFTETEVEKVVSSIPTKAVREVRILPSKSNANSTLKNLYTTVMMNESDMIKTRYNQKLNHHYVSSAFKCKLCILGFHFLKQLTDHETALHREVPGHVECDICHMFVGATELTRHRTEHYLCYKCLKCEFTDYNIERMFRHLKDEHWDECLGRRKRESYPCPECNQFFPSSIRRWRHVEREHRDRPQCDLCKKIVVNKYSMRMHMTRCHGDSVTSEKCPLCRKQVRSAYMRRHIALHDQRKAPASVRCEPCNKTFPSPILLKKHEKYSQSHNSDKTCQYKCPACGRAFWRKDKMKAHFDSQHLNKTNTCNVCKKIPDPTWKSSNGGENRQKDDEESIEANTFDDDVSEKKFNEQEKRKVQNIIRCQRYRDKKRNDGAVNSQISKPPTMSAEEEERIKRQKEKDKQKSQRYRDKKRATNLINLQTDQPSITVVKLVSKVPKILHSPIAGPSSKCLPYVQPTHDANLSTRNELDISETLSDYNDETHNDIASQAQIGYSQIHETDTNDEPNTQNYPYQNISPRDLQNNTQNMQSRHLPVQKYTFQQNFSAQREF